MLQADPSPSLPTHIVSIFIRLHLVTHTCCKQIRLLPFPHLLQAPTHTCCKQIQLYPSHTFCKQIRPDPYSPILQAHQTPSIPTHIASRSDSISSRISCKQIRLHLLLTPVASRSDSILSKPVASRSDSILSTHVTSRSDSIPTHTCCKQIGFHPFQHILQVDQTPSLPTPVASRSDSIHSHTYCK